MNFALKSDFAPMGDQPEAIRQLVEGVRNGQRAQAVHRLGRYRMGGKPRFDKRYVRSGL